MHNVSKNSLEAIMHNQKSSPFKDEVWFAINLQQPATSLEHRFKLRNKTTAML